MAERSEFAGGGLGLCAGAGEFCIGTAPGTFEGGDPALDAGEEFGGRGLGEECGGEGVAGRFGE
ncbi:MAG: hypothetical protein NTW28_19260 [Candidatus Solibacter sp.]|nr:hypothetical protein [Candidatus Solibacter sp.]